MFRYSKSFPHLEKDFISMSGYIKKEPKPVIILRHYIKEKNDISSTFHTGFIHKVPVDRKN